MKNRCLICNKNESQKHPTLGVVPCALCQKVGRLRNQLRSTHEFVPSRILEDRKSNAKDILQPYRDGTLSKEYLEAYGTKGISPTKDQVKNARKVWGEDTYYK